MPKTVTVNRAQVEAINLVVEGTKTVGLEVRIAVNYGTFGQTEVVDLWGDLTATQKDFLQALADKANLEIQKIYLG